MNMDELRRQIMTLLDEAEIIIKAPPAFFAMKDKVTLVIDGKAGIADDILSLIAPELEKARKWDRVKDTHEFKFVRHIESHLSGNQVPICTICGKTIFEIALEGKEG